MGTWGTGVFDNDAAADWVYGLGEGGLSYIEQTLEGDGEEALAAAEVVARLRSGNGEDSVYAEEVPGFVEANRTGEWQYLVTPAVAALDRLLDPGQSEQYELWAETDHLDDWLSVIAEVRARLQ